MKASGWISVSLVFMALVAGNANAADANAAQKTESPSTIQPADWIPHALIVDLRNLPKRYTCDELWYKFRDVLLTIGARTDLKVLPYRCEGRLGSIAYSPKVQLEFSLPRVVSGKPAQSADLRVVSRNIRLEPGAPAHLDTSDCVLLNQIRGTLFKAVGTHVSHFRLACQALPAIEPAFTLTAQVLLPAAQHSTSVAGMTPVHRADATRSGS